MPGGWGVTGLRMRIDVLTIFPGIFEGFLRESLIGMALDRGLLDVRLHDFRHHARDPHRSVDDKPYGGGPGMVLKPEPIFECLDDLLGSLERRPRMLLPSPVGTPFHQGLARELAAEEHLLFLCARYEGYDERIVEAWGFEEVSLGDYVLMGGEVPTMAMIEAIARLRPGVLGHDLSALEDSFEKPRLDHPHYTRPRVFRGLEVPEVLLSGDHARIAAWRKEAARERTRTRRPDLLQNGDDEGKESAGGRG